MFSKATRICHVRELSIRVCVYVRAFNSIISIDMSESDIQVITLELIHMSKIHAPTLRTKPNQNHHLPQPL